MKDVTAEFSLLYFLMFNALIIAYIANFAVVPNLMFEMKQQLKLTIMDSVERGGGQ